MARRVIQQEVKQIFNKYVGGTLGQRLKRAEALTMLQTEFKLSNREANIMFDIYDKDQNDEFSLWEFQQFYNDVGYRAHDMIACFDSLEKEDSGMLDMERAFDSLKEMKTQDDQPVKEDELAMLMKVTAGEDKFITLTKFINLLCRLKLDFNGYQPPESSPQHCSEEDPSQVQQLESPQPGF